MKETLTVLAAVYRHYEAKTLHPETNFMRTEAKLESASKACLQNKTTVNDQCISQDKFPLP